MSVDTARDEQFSRKTSRSIPVFVMLPLDTVNADGVFRYASASWFSQALQVLAASGVNGVAVDAWWGAIEKEPQEYNWSGYKQLMETIKGTGLKVQVVLSCHACGGNVGDSVQIPLPPWVLQCGENDPDLFFTDRPRDGKLGNRNREYISIWADDALTLCGRTPMQCYKDFITSFRETMSAELGTLIEEVVIGTGPCGELRFPSYAESNGWRFPGVGEFQCYDRRALASLAQAAREAGYPEWGNGGPHDSGDYSTTPEESGFFSYGGSWDTAYGRFFLEWYSSSLLKHGDRLLQSAKTVLGTHLAPRKLSNTSSEASANTHELPPFCSASMLHASPRVAGAEAGQRTADVQRQGGATEGEDGPHPPGPSHGAGAGAKAGGSGGTGSRAAVGAEVAASAEAGPTGPGHGRGPAHIGSETETAAAMLLGGSGCPPVGTAPPLADDQSSEYMTPTASSNALDSVASERTETESLQQSSMEAAQALGAGSCREQLSITLKIAGIHWWFRSRSHAAELTAGYYNTANRDGYAGIVDICAKHGANLTLTCVEMCDTQHPSAALCGPEGLLKQIRGLCATRNVPLSGENALPIFQLDQMDSVALERIVFNTRAWHGAAAMSAYFSNGSSSTLPSPLLSPFTQPLTPLQPGLGLVLQPGLGLMQGQGLVRQGQPSSSGTFPFPSSDSGSFTAPQPAPSLASRHTYSLGNMPVVGINVNTNDTTRHSFSCEASPFGPGPSGASGTRNSFLPGGLPPVRSDPAIAATGLRADSYANISKPLPPMRSFTLLRLCQDLLQPSFQGPWLRFMTLMQQGGFH